MQSSNMLAVLALSQEGYKDRCEGRTDRVHPRDKLVRFQVYNALGKSVVSDMRKDTESGELGYAAKHGMYKTVQC